MRNRSELGVHAVCCLLHNLTPGGSAWQWVHLLGRHVERGGLATIFAPHGPLATPARSLGIEVVDTPPWKEGLTVARSDRGLWDKVETHQVAIVQWEQGVMEAFAPALEACGRAALTLHQAPRSMRRWFGPPTLAKAQGALELAATERRAIAMVRGEAHRRQVASAFDVPPDRLRILPASVPLPALTFRPSYRERPRDVLAMIRLSQEKAAVARLAVELVRERLAAGSPCRLTVAGEGPWRTEAEALCERRLPPGSWRIEGAPEDPIATLSTADVVVAQGLTTLEAAALGRRTIVARTAGDDGAAGAVLTPARYDEAARDPFGEPPLTSDADRLWREVLAVEEGDLRALRGRVEADNSVEVTSRALGRALASTTDWPGRLVERLRR